MKRAIMILMLSSCLLCALSGCSNGKDDSTAATYSSRLETESEQTEYEMTEEEKIKSVYKNCLESTFCIFTSTNNNGTGFLYKEKYIITNTHVLYDTDDFTLVDHNQKEHKGTVIFSDGSTDISVIQLDDYEGKSVTFGNSDNVSVGEQVLLIGNPYNGTPFSYCTGKRVAMDKKLQQTLDPEEWYIPLDAGIISGYSGGPAFNMNGELIGISNAAYTGDCSEYGFEYLSLIIPIDHVKDQIESALP